MASSDEATSDPIPMIPDMELLRHVGHGGFGEVWLARNRTTGGLRAVKLIRLHPPGDRDPAGREIASLSFLEQQVRIQHPNLVTIHHVGTTTEHLFYIMDPADDVSGTAASIEPQYQPATLTSRLARGPVAADECERLSRQLLSGLAHLHQQGLVHRDVKPSNCLFIGGELKLADFGLLTQADRTISGVGTPSYMPPDHIMDMRADVYAAGLVIYELITGLPVSRFPSLLSRAKAVLEAPRLAVLNRVIVRASALDRAARFPNAQAMLDELERLLACESSGIPYDSAETLGKVRRLAVVSLGSAVGLAALAAALWWGRGRPTEVDVNFVTDRFDATIWLDGEVLRDLGGNAYTTPCTVPGLSADVHDVVFKRPGLPDLELGRIDFSKTRDIDAHWPDEGAP